VLNRDNVGYQVQDGLGLPGTWRPLDDRNRTGQGFLQCRALTEIAAERKNMGNILGRDSIGEPLRKELSTLSG
jgi:hypothetical protein